MLDFGVMLAGIRARPLLGIRAGPLAGILARPLALYEDGGLRRGFASRGLQGAA